MSRSTDTEIAGLAAWEVLDSRGNPTVACQVRLAGGAAGEAAVPSGASTGSHEARELRDGGTRYGGRGVRLAVANVVDKLSPMVIGLDAEDQEALDAALRAADGTANLGRLGANAVLAVSVAAAIAMDYFTSNHRITSVEVSHDGTVVGTFPLDPGKRGRQAIPVAGSGGDYRIKVLATLPGTNPRWRELVVSELRVVGIPAVELRRQDIQRHRSKRGGPRRGRARCRAGRSPMDHGRPDGPRQAVQAACASRDCARFASRMATSSSSSMAGVRG